MKKLWSHVTKWQKLLVVTLVLAGILWMTGFDSVDSGVVPKEVEAATIVHSGKDGALNWSIDDTGLLLVEGEGDYVGKNYDTANGNSYVAPEWLEYKNEIETAVVKVKHITSLRKMFYGCEKLSWHRMNLDELDTTDVTDMSQMFCGCKKISYLNLNGFNTSNVADMSDMFNGCEELHYLDVDRFDTKNVTNMSNMFRECEELKELDISGFDTGNVTNMSGMFEHCADLKNIDISGFDTRNVTDMNHMFNKFWTLETLDVSNFDTRNVTDMSYMFSNMPCLINLDLSGFDTRNVTNMEHMFSGSFTMKNLDLSKFNTEKVTNMSGMFYECMDLTKLDVSSFDTRNVTDMSQMFHKCWRLETLDVSNFDTRNVTDMGWMFGIMSDGDTGLKTLDVSNFDTRNVIYMDSMFDGCTLLETLDVSGFDTRNVRNMASMFSGCEKLETLDVSRFDTTNVGTMEYMFWGCKKLKTLDVSNFDARNVTDMSCMFKNCEKLEKIDMGKFNARNLKGIRAMFENCKSLVSLDLSTLDVSETIEGEETNELLSGCINLMSINTPINRSRGRGWLPEGDGEWKDESGTIYKSLPGKMDKSITLTREMPEKDFKQSYVSLKKSSYEYTGKEIQPEVVITYNKVTLVENINYTVAYEDNISLGKAKVIVTGKGSYVGTVVVEFTIGPKKLKSQDVEITIQEAAYEYKGNEIQPIVTIKDAFGNILVEDIDYTVSYKDNINAGTAKVIITGKGNYTGTINYGFTINPKEFDSKEIDIALEKTAYEYTGTPIQPTVIVKDASEKVLTEDTDYTVSYESNTNAGTATVTVTGKGNYKGTIPVEFTIAPKTLTLRDEDVIIDNNGFVCDGNVYEYTGEEIKPVLTINGLTEGTDYELSYKNNVEEGTATVTATCKGNYSGEYIYEYMIVKEPVFTWNKEKCTSDAGTPEVTVKERINPTCAKAGRILYVATLEHMGKVYTSENAVQLPATGKHSWDKGVVKGSKLIYTCKVCKQTKSVERKVKSIAIAGLSHNIAAGKKVALTATVLPANAINKKVVWTTSNKTVATVSQSGIVAVLKNTGKKSVIITATAADGSKVKQTFKITSMKGVVTKVSLSGKNTLAVEKSQKVKATVKASAGAYKSLKWTSSNVKYATVSSNGTVKAQKAGKGKKVTITAMALDGSGKKATFSIKIK